MVHLDAIENNDEFMKQRFKDVLLSREIFTAKAEGAYHLFQYSKWNRMFIGFCFLCITKSLNVDVHDDI